MNLGTLYVSSTRTVSVNTAGSPNDRVTVTFLAVNHSTPTVYYKTSPDVSASSFDGSLNPGDSVTLDREVRWFVAATTADGTDAAGKLSLVAPEEENFAGELFRKSATNTFQVSADHGATWTDVSGTGPAGPAGADGAAGPQGLPGTAPYTSVEQLSGTPGSVTDWGPLIQTAITNGARHFQFGERDYPFLTPLDVHGESTSIVFEGSRGRGWYSGGDVHDLWGSRLIWKGGASPVVTVTDAAITSGSKVLTSATGPWTLGSILHSGQPITLVGAGAGGADLVTTIASRQSNTQVTLVDAAGTTVSGATASFTNWTRAIQGQGSTALQFHNMKLVYDNAAFDGILVDMRSAPSPDTWAARGQLDNCMVGGASGVTGAWALLALSGHGEMFSANDCTFSNAQRLVAGMYQNNADDAHFVNCNFEKFYVAACTNPGRFWKFTNCRAGGSQNSANTKLGPVFMSEPDGSANLNPVIELDNFKLWDPGKKALTDAAITSGSNTLTSASAPFTGAATNWVNRIVQLRGAAAGGGDLYTRITGVISTTQVTLRDNAGATVSAASCNVCDGGLLYTQSGTPAWTVYVKNLMTWLNASPEIEMRGPGTLMVEQWWTNRFVGPDLTGILGDGPFIELGSSATDKKTLWVRGLLPSGRNGILLGDERTISNIDGHDVREVSGTSFARGLRTVNILAQETVQTDAPTNASGLPTVALSAGQTAGTTFAVYGTDMIGYITATTTASGAVAGKLADITFAKPWRSLAPSFTSGRAYIVIHLTPLEASTESGVGNASVDAAAFAVTNNANPATGWTLSIRNAVTGAKTLRWAYRIVRT